MLLRIISLLFVPLLLLPTNLLAGSFVYVSVAGENRIAVYSRDPATGQLTHRSDVSLSGEPGALAASHDGKSLFASIRSTGQLASFGVEGATGRLKQLNEISAGADPAYLSLDRSENYLLSAYYRAAKVMVHRISDDGTIVSSPVQEVPTAEKAHAILTDRSNRFAFVPHTGPNLIFQFKFDQRTGRLEVGTVDRVQRPDNTGPRHLLFHPSENFAYTSDEQGSSITAFRFLPDKGHLEAIQVESTLPASFSERNSTAHLEIHPSGRFVFVANRGHDSLAVFRIEPRTGRITSLGQTKVEPTPRSFNCSPDGKHLYAAGQGSGKLAAFAVDGSTGSLRRIATYDVGDRPWWVLVLETEP
jgi:6-phosphogluconolactonase